MTTTTTPLRPAMKRPRPRDFQIFRDAEILGLTHAEIALNSTKLTRRRVSQIVARVRRWLSLHPCDDPRLASELQRKQLARHVERMHLENIVTKARDELVYGKKELTTTREKEDGTKIVTTRQQPFNVQVLKVYLKSVETLAKLQEKPDVNLPLPEECEFPWLEGAINEVYDKWSDKIWSGTLKPKAIAEMIDDIVAAALRAAATQKRARDGSVGNALCGVPCAASEEQDTLARSASEGKPPCHSDDVAASADSPSTEYSVPSTADDQNAAASTLDLGTGTLDHSATTSHTSLAGPSAGDQTPATTAAPTASPTTTSAPTSLPESPASNATTSLKNPKREASQSPDPYPPVPVSPSPLPPCPATAIAPRVIYL